MNASKGNNKKSRNRATVNVGSKNKQLLPALMAVGGVCGMMAMPASALELGDLKIESSLGQPLRASIAYALNPREQLYDFCVYLRPGIAASGLPAVSKAMVSVANGVILLTGSRPIREPLLTMQVSINCPYTAQLSRDYTLMIDPVERIADSPAPTQPSISRVEIVDAAAPAASAVKPEPQPRAQRPVQRPPISESSRYLVQRGDSLSEIASRISNRSVALWPAVDRIFAANPHAFMDGDMNQLKAGAWLEIPDLSVAAPESIASQSTTTAPAEQASEASATTAYPGYQVATETETAQTEESTAPVAEAPVEITQAVPDAEAGVTAEPDTAGSGYADLQPGDVVVGSDNPFVSPIGPLVDSELDEELMIPDTDVLEPVVNQPVPVVKTSPDTRASGGTSGSWSWLAWLGGTGLALILGLLLFGRRIRQRFGSVAVGAPRDPALNQQRTDTDTQRSEAIADVDFQVPDASPHSASMTLDADFDDGTGLQDAADIDVAQDFGFSASTTFEDQLDMVIPPGAADEEESGPTDIIPPPERADEESILDSEVPPGEDDSQYDLSMIVDPTKQSVVEADATEKDLQAVQVDAADESESEDYALDQEVDYKVLEQDYEDELTATQALNAEIEKAAAELAERMDNDATGEITTELPKDTVAVNDDLGDDDDTGINEELAAEMPSADDDAQLEISANDDDVTANMEIESGKLDTKKNKKAS